MHVVSCRYAAIYQWHYLHCMKSTGRTEKSVSNRSSMCEREGSKIRGCTATRLLELRDKRQECKDSAHRRGSSSLLQPKNILALPFLLVAQKCCITSQNKKNKNSYGPSKCHLGHLKSHTEVPNWLLHGAVSVWFFTETTQCQSLARAPGFQFSLMALPIKAVFACRPNRPALLTVVHH